jgi:hypothetical protein
MFLLTYRGEETWKPVRWKKWYNEARGANVDSATSGYLTVDNHCVISRNIWSSTSARTACCSSPSSGDWRQRAIVLESSSTVSIIGMFVTISHCGELRVVDCAMPFDLNNNQLSRIL